MSVKEGERWRLTTNNWSQKKRQLITLSWHIITWLSIDRYRSSEKKVSQFFNCSWILAVILWIHFLSFFLFLFVLLFFWLGLYLRLFFSSRVVCVQYLKKKQITFTLFRIWPCRLSLTSKTKRKNKKERKKTIVFESLFYLRLLRNHWQIRRRLNNC